jgi:hypothetical protein
VEIQPVQRRAAQALGVLVIAGGLTVLLPALAAVLGLVTDLARTWGAALMWLATAAGGAIILLIGIGLLSWGGGRWRSPSSQR